ncbi:unnamed protein product [Caenorhabditis brenneri]
MQSTQLNVPSFETASITIRADILQCVLEKKSVWETDTYISAAHGKDILSYQEVDYWYYKFYNGDHDLKDTRSLDYKPLTIADLPEDAFDHILDRVKPFERLILRRTGKQQQQLYQAKPINCKVIKFFCGLWDAWITVDSTNWSYFAKEDGCVMTKSKTKCGKFSVFFKGFDHIGMSFHDFFLLLKDEKLKLEKLSIRIQIYPELMLNSCCIPPLARFRSLLNSLSHQIHTKEIMVTHIKLDDVGFILAALKPGILKTILLPWFSENEASYMIFDPIRKLAQMIQWKKAEHCGSVNLLYQEFPTYFSHFSELTFYSNSFFDRGDYFFMKAMSSLPNCRAIHRFDAYSYSMITNIPGFTLTLNKRRKKCGYGTRILEETGQKFDIFVTFYKKRGHYITVQRAS